MSETFSNTLVDVENNIYFLEIGHATDGDAQIDYMDGTCKFPYDADGNIYYPGTDAATAVGPMSIKFTGRVSTDEIVLAANFYDENDDDLGYRDSCTLSSPHNTITE